MVVFLIISLIVAFASSLTPEEWEKRINEVEE